MTTLSQDCLINQDNSFFLFENPPSGQDLLNGSLDVTGDVTVGASLAVTGNMTSDGTLSTQGDVIAVGNISGNNLLVSSGAAILGDITLPVYSNTIPQPLSLSNNFILGFGLLITNPAEPEGPPFCEVLYSNASENDYVFLSRSSDEAILPEAVGALYYGNRTPGVGFTVFSTLPTDAGSTFNYLILKGVVATPPAVNTATFNYPVGTGLPTTFITPKPTFVFVFNNTGDPLGATSTLKINCTGIKPATLNAFVLSPSIPGTTVVLDNGTIVVTLGSDLTGGFTLTLNASTNAISVDECLVTVVSPITPPSPVPPAPSV